MPALTWAAAPVKASTLGLAEAAQPGQVPFLAYAPTTEMVPDAEAALLATGTMVMVVRAVVAGPAGVT